MTGPHVLAYAWASTITGGVLLPVLVTLIAGAIVYLVRKVPQIIKAATTAAQTAEATRVALEARLDAQDRSLAAVVKETHTNGGSSLKDAVNRVEAGQKQQAADLAAHLLEAAFDRGKVEAFMASVGSAGSSSVVVGADAVRAAV